MALASGPPKAQHEVLGKSGGLGCFDDDRVVSRCNPSTERDFFCKKTCIYQKKAVSLQVELIFMPTRSNEISLFLAFCIEQYKQRHHLTGEQSMRLMDQYNVLDYLQTNYEPLHTQNAQWIMEDIDEFINHRKQ